MKQPLQKFPVQSLSRQGVFFSSLFDTVVRYGVFFHSWFVCPWCLLRYILSSLVYQTTVSDHLYFPVHCLSDYSDRPNIFLRSGSITLRCLIRYLPIDNVLDSSDCYLYFYSSTTLYIIIYIPCLYFCLVGLILIA